MMGEDERARSADKVDTTQRLAFLGLGAEERGDLLAIRPLLEQHADALVAAFYRHLLAFDRTRKLLRDPEVKRRLLEKQRSYLVSLSNGHYDEDFLTERVAIGETHERIGLEPRWYLGAYALYFSLLAPLVMQTYRTEPARAERTLSALVKQLLLDAQLAMEAYGARHTRELEYLNRELAASGQSLARDFEERGVELRQTERRALAAEDLASTATLVAGLAHEIGTPMNVIQGHAELLESSVSDEGGLARLRTIREQIARISRIIRTLLSAARPREVVCVPLALQPILEMSLSFLEEKFRAQRIEIERQWEWTPQIRGDGEKLQQLFLNLLLNAVDAMPDGGSIVVALCTSPDGEAEIRIRDTGSGIPDQALARIFEPFFSTKTAGHGSGLGLVVARQIVLDHDGEIEVESEAGVGTEFRIVLPALDPGASVRRRTTV